MNDGAAPVGEGELREIIGKWSDTARDYPREATLHQLIAEQAAQTPEATAVVFEGEPLSYGELERRSNQVAHHLIAQGVETGQPVALAIERSLAMVVGLLGIMKAGGAYIPLDPAWDDHKTSGLVILVAPGLYLNCSSPNCVKG